jgi:hypothetical protein
MSVPRVHHGCLTMFGADPLSLTQNKEPSRGKELPISTLWPAHFVVCKGSCRAVSTWPLVLPLGATVRTQVRRLWAVQRGVVTRIGSPSLKG